MKVSISVAPKTAEEFGALCAEVKAAGFDAVDLGLYQLYPHTSVRSHKRSEMYSQSMEELQAFFTPFKQAAADNDIEVALMHAIFPGFEHADAEFEAYHREVLKKNIAICGFFGCQYIVVHSYTERDRLTGGTLEQERAINMGLYTSLIPAAKEHGVTVCLENLFYTDGNKRFNGSCSHAREAVQYVDDLNAIAGEEVFGFCFDSGHATLCGENTYDFIHTLGSRLKALHLHDNYGMSDDHLHPYTGMMRWDYLLAALREIGYTGGLNFETFVYGSVHGKTLPEKVRPIMLKYVADIGHYFVEEIQG